MPRQARLDAPGVLHHIMVRGIERRKIFLNDHDRVDFLRRLSEILPETETTCHAWVFIPNHAHLLFRTGRVPISSVMRRLLTGYAVSFNRRHTRRGHLFQNRYKSIMCQEDVYLKELVRYIHLNPIRAGLVPGIRELNKYPYSGHAALIGTQERAWQDVSGVLGYFGNTIGAARGAYLAFVESGVSQGRRDDLTGGGLVRSVGGWAEVRELKRLGYEHVMGDERILGDSAFVKDLLLRADERYERRYELKRQGYTVDRVAERVGEIYDMDPQEILSQGGQRRKVKARSLFCYWAVRELGMSLRELAGRLEMTPPAIGYSVERGERIAREEKHRLVE